MRFIEFTLGYNLLQKTIKFSEGANLIYSLKNAVGKTTFLRALFYALGYQIPSTKGIKFDDMDFWLTVESGGNIYNLYRHDSYLSIDDGNDQIEYSLPTDFYEIQAKLTGCHNKDILDNLLGASYVDQEKGWTLLNRGKVIGNISFNIEALVRGLSGIDCASELQQLESVKRQQRKYEYMQSVAKYQEAIREEAEDIDFDTPDEDINRRLEVLKTEREPISNEQKQIKSILRKNKLLAEYISDMNLWVKSSSGEEIPVTKETLVAFTDNNKLLVARREMLAAELNSINRQIAALEQQKGKDEQIINVQTRIEAFDSDIKKINVDPIATQAIINELKRERKKLQERIRSMTKGNSDVISELYKSARKYVEELPVDNIRISQNKDYIFTSDLKSLSGTNLHLIVFSFKLAYLRLIKEKTGIILPIVLDSPSGREVKHDSVEKMLEIVQRDFSDHQLIVASIYDYNLKNKKIIEFKDRLLNVTDFAYMN